MSVITEEMMIRRYHRRKNMYVGNALFLRSCCITTVDGTPTITWEEALEYVKTREETLNILESLESF